jgi:phosphatidylglycerophosphatase A
MSSRLVASALGVGFSPVAPGTAGSLVAVALGAGLLQLSPWALGGAAALAALAGFVAIPRAVTERGADPGWVVIDEVAGQWIALLGLGTVTLPGLVAAFALFRLLDITKPGPVGWADRQHGAFGIMVDDLLAGAIAAVLLWGLRWAWPGVLG